jgi:hypothetical protein
MSSEPVIENELGADRIMDCFESIFPDLVLIYEISKMRACKL